MSERTEAQRKKALQERRKQRNKMIRRRRMIFFGGIAVVAVAVVLIITLLVKTLTGSIVSANTLTLTDTGVTFEEISSTEDLSKSEIKSYAKEVINAFNKESGEKLVKLDKVKEKKGVVYVKTSYDSIEAYSDFSGYEAYSGTVASVTEAGVDLSAVTFVSVADGKKGDVADAETVTSDDSLKILIIQENATFVVNGEIQYVSDENTTVVDASTVSTVNEDGSDDSAVWTYIIYK